VDDKEDTAQVGRERIALGQVSFRLFLVDQQIKISCNGNAMAVKAVLISFGAGRGTTGWLGVGSKREPNSGLSL